MELLTLAGYHRREPFWILQLFVLDISHPSSQPTVSKHRRERIGQISTSSLFFHAPTDFWIGLKVSRITLGQRPDTFWFACSMQGLLFTASYSWSHIKCHSVCINTHHFMTKNQKILWVHYSRPVPRLSSTREETPYMVPCPLDCRKDPLLSWTILSTVSDVKNATPFTLACQLCIIARDQPSSRDKCMISQ